MTTTKALVLFANIRTRCGGVSLLLILMMDLLATTKGLPTINRSSFPKGFIFGAGSASYQIEGATNVDGKGLSNWDYYTHKNPSLTADGSNGDVADDFYHRYKEDIKMMKHMGLDSFRFSISWTRILPKGNKASGINQLGINFYNNVINELLAHGIKPFVTLYHWDLPQALEDKYNSFLSRKIVADFVDFADICFKEFGDRVKYWTTLNEPNMLSMLGYAKGLHVPNRCTPNMEGYPKCVAGNSSTEPYIVGHNLLLSHAAAVKLYKDKYQGSQGGEIGIAIGCDWGEPYDNSPQSKIAAERYYEHMCGWMLNPVKFGVYPKSMRLLVGSRLPKFTKEERNMLKNSYDFIGLNSYSSTYARDQRPKFQHYDQDDHVNKTYTNAKGLICKPTPSPLVYVCPQGLQKLLGHMRIKYENPTIIITENGYPTKLEGYKADKLKLFLEDVPRINYLQQHLVHVRQAIKEGVDVKGYFVWSFMDNFEWNGGYLSQFGLVYVDRKDGLRRYTKKSGKWYQRFLHS